MKQVVLTLLLFATLRDPALFFAQGKLSTNSSPNDNQNLKRTAIGEGYVFGRHAAFRTYETPDHTDAVVWYGEFRSEQEAKYATKLWLKEHRVTGKENIKDLNGQVIGDRTVAAPKQGKKAFMVIRKHGLNYWMIQSISLAVAMQVDGLIEPPPPQPTLAKDKKNPSSCDRSVEFLSRQQKLFKEEQKKVHQIRAQGMVKILVSTNGDVVSASVISVNKGSLASSAEAIDFLSSQAKSMRFKPRPGCGDYGYVVIF